MSNEYKEAGVGLGFITLMVGLAVVVVGFIAVFVFQAFQPTWLSWERKATQQSPAYVESKRHALVELKAKYGQIETEVARYQGNEGVVNSLRAQQRNVLKQMYEEKSLIPDDAVPPDVKMFLKEHPQ